MVDLWSKFRLNVCNNLPQAILGAGVGCYRDSEHMRIISDALKSELEAVATAKGIDLSLAEGTSVHGSAVPPSARSEVVYGIFGQHKSHIPAHDIVRYGVHIWSVCGGIWTRAVAPIEACPNLRYIGVLATGYNVVDVEAAHEHGIVVTNVPAYSTDAVAQFTFALLLELANRVGAHDASVKDGGWVRSKDFSYSVMPTMELAGKTMGIIGYGSIGMKVAEIAHAFGMRVLVNSRI